MFCKSSSPRPSAFSGCWKPVLQWGHPACPAYATLKNKVEPSPATVPETCTTWHPNMSLDKHTKIKTAVGYTDKWRLRMWASEHVSILNILMILVPFLYDSYHVITYFMSRLTKKAWSLLGAACLKVFGAVGHCRTLWAPANLINAYQRSVI